MKRLMSIDSSSALPLSIRQIRYLVYLFSACVLGLTVLSWGVLLRYRLHEAVERQEMVLQSQSEQLQAKLHGAEALTVRALGSLTRLSDIGLADELAAVSDEQWTDRLRRRGDRQYIPLLVPPASARAPGARLKSLADVMTFTFRVNNLQYRDVQNAYLVDLQADQLYVIPRRLDPARALMQRDDVRQTFLRDTLARLRNDALVARLRAHPGQAVVLPPALDWVSGMRTVTFATLVQVGGEPAAVLAMEFPLSPMLPDGQTIDGDFVLVTDAGMALSADGMPAGTLGQSVTASLAAPGTRPGRVSSALVRQGLLDYVVVLEYQFDAWGWRTVGVIALGQVWHQFRQNALWMLGLTGSLSMLILAWIWLIDRRIMRPAQRQSLRLQESDALGRFVIEVAGVGLMIVERSTRQVLLANAAAHSITDQATPAGLAQLQDACDARLTSEGTTTEGMPRVQPCFDVDLVGRNGQTRYLEVRQVEITYEGRAAVLRALNDVTDARRSEARLREAIRAADAANHAKSSFLATMSHEIRTPLNGMLGSIELLGLTRLDSRQRDQLAVMQHASQSLIYIINDVLDFSKIEAGQMSLQLRPCRVEEIVEDVTRRFAAEAARKQLRLLCVNDPSLVEPVMADVVKLEQILNNLVSNAVKFTEQGKVIVTAMRKPGGGVEIRVIDTGIGIAARDQRRLFEPFVQAEQPDTRHYGGTGLGLSICRRLVGLMSGEIRLVSEPGLGSCFTVSLPLASAGAEAPADAWPRTALRGLTVGLNVTLRELYQGVEQLLQFYGARAVKYDPAAPPATPVDVLVCDEQAMPRCNDADVVVSAMAPAVPDLTQTPVVASPYAWRGLLAAIAAAAGVEVTATQAPVPARDDTPAVQLALLLVEDHPINQVVMREQLENLGQKVDLAGDGPEALLMASGRHYDLVLTDLQMPGMDGFTLARCLRDAGLATPIVAVTASVGPDVSERCQQAGIDRCLTKPVGLGTLRKLLEDLSGTHMATRAAPGAHAGGDTLLHADALRRDQRALAEALLAGDAEAFAQRLHGLAGALSVMGHALQSQACRWLEQAVRRSGLVAIGPDWQAFHAELELLADGLESQGGTQGANYTADLRHA
ncbi:histidine kinase [Cupriavidus necator]|uniref:Virulence sensor protein BvgS n=2 Tax=Cupriavidus necator (strain ATCC 17699 / DSM 428 / KCTC 22496 / NCIMB 10442 / H16 / Stanier 337) TaxID=381666 RepID=Q0JZF7_CUPNH|nr:hybrid sensor histidine kinase/response regulator [Cupriavidus necator]WKA43587.1 ATP-binding protein [Cupriavidus necator]CAJ96867.1 signal transduction histidine kinase containing a receiver domain (hybrid) [Cupriavidus necator H16]